MSSYRHPYPACLILRSNTNDMDFNGHLCAKETNLICSNVEVQGLQLQFEKSHILQFADPIFHYKCVNFVFCLRGKLHFWQVWGQVAILHLYRE